VLQKEQKNYQADKKSFLLLEAIIAIVVISIALSLFFDSKVAISNYLNMLVKREELDKLFWQASYDFANPTLIKTSTNITKTTKSINCYIKKSGTKLYISVLQNISHNKNSCFLQTTLKYANNKTGVYYYAVQ
jgi:hypothetical protein